jgi:hypothetical protein
VLEKIAEDLAANWPEQRRALFELLPASPG